MRRVLAWCVTLAFPLNLAAQAIAPSNPDILYVGSGEGLQRPDLSTGDGIYKSLDAAAPTTQALRAANELERALRIALARLDALR